MKVSGVDYTFFAVSDMQRSLAFYRGLLGIPVCATNPGWDVG